MAFKIILALCAVAQIAYSQCCGAGLGGIGGGLGLGAGLGSGLGAGLGSGLGAGIGSGIGAGLGSGIGCGGCGGVSSTGGNFPTISASPNQPTGISVQSENQYEGQLCLGGNVPFLGTVALEGQVPTGGNSQVSYGCGSGDIGITSERGASTGISSPGTYQPGPGALSCGCGCGGRW